MRTCHRCTLHVSVTGFAHMERKGRKDTSDFTKSVVLVDIIPIVVLVSARGRDCCTRTIVAVYSWSKVARCCSYRYEIRISSRIAGCRSGLVSTGKDGKTSFDHTVRRACVVDEVVKCLPLKYIIIFPLFVCRILWRPLKRIGSA